RLPGGRQATIDFLKNFAGPPRHGIAFPAGASTLMLRRMVLINKDGLPRATLVVENVRIRHFPEGGEGEEVAFSFTLRRKDLFSGRSGGLHQVTPDETSLFSFEHLNDAKVDYLEKGIPPGLKRVMESCSQCHDDIVGRGVHTVRSLFGPRYAPPEIQPTT